MKENQLRTSNTQYKESILLCALVEKFKSDNNLIIRDTLHLLKLSQAQFENKALPYNLRDMWESILTKLKYIDPDNRSNTNKWKQKELRELILYTIPIQSKSSAPIRSDEEMKQRAEITEMLLKFVDLEALSEELKIAKQNHDKGQILNICQFLQNITVERQKICGFDALNDAVLEQKEQNAVAIRNESLQTFFDLAIEQENTEMAGYFIKNLHHHGTEEMKKHTVKTYLIFLLSGLKFMQQKDEVIHLIQLWTELGADLDNIYVQPSRKLKVEIRVTDPVCVKGHLGKWHDIEILEQKNHEIRVHYKGWSDKWNEWINSQEEGHRLGYRTQKYIIPGGLELSMLTFTILSGCLEITEKLVDYGARLFQAEILIDIAKAEKWLLLQSILKDVPDGIPIANETLKALFDLALEKKNAEMVEHFFRKLSHHENNDEFKEVELSNISDFETKESKRWFKVIQFEKELGNTKLLHEIVDYFILQAKKYSQKLEEDNEIDDAISFWENIKQNDLYTNKRHTLFSRSTITREIEKNILPKLKNEKEVSSEIVRILGGKDKVSELRCLHKP